MAEATAWAISSAASRKRSSTNFSTLFTSTMSSCLQCSFFEPVAALECKVRGLPLGSRHYFFVPQSTLGRTPFFVGVHPCRTILYDALNELYALQQDNLLTLQKVLMTSQMLLSSQIFHLCQLVNAIEHTARFGWFRNGRHRHLFCHYPSHSSHALLIVLCFFSRSKRSTTAWSAPPCGCCCSSFGGGGGNPRGYTWWYLFCRLPHYGQYHSRRYLAPPSYRRRRRHHHFSS